MKYARIVSLLLSGVASISIANATSTSSQGNFQANVPNYIPASVPGSGVLIPSFTTTGSANTSLPTNTGTVVVYNTGSVDAYIALGGSGMTLSNTGLSTAGKGDIVKAGCWSAFGTNATVTNILAVTQSGATTLTISGGTGTPNSGCTSSSTPIGNYSLETGGVLANMFSAMSQAVPSMSATVPNYIGGVIGWSNTSVASLAQTTASQTMGANTGWNAVTPVVFTFTNACRAAASNGTPGMVIIPQIDIYDTNTASVLNGTLFLFSATIGNVIGKGSTFTVSAADYLNITGSNSGFPFTLAPLAPASGGSGVTLATNSYHAQCISGATTIYGMVEVNTSYTTSAATSPFETLTIRLHTIGLN